METDKNQIMSLIKSSFEKHMKFDGFNVDFSKSGLDTIVAKFSGSYKFKLIGSTPAECLRSMGGLIGESFTLEDSDNTIQVLLKDEESTVMEFEGLNTIYAKGADDEEAEQIGRNIAESFSLTIQSVIVESKKKSSNGDLPMGSRNVNQWKPKN
jgi:hypothetical protein